MYILLLGKRTRMNRFVEVDYILAFVLWIGHDFEAKENVIAQNFLYPDELFDVISRFISYSRRLHG